MEGIEHLNSKKIRKVCEQLWMIEGSLRGLGASLQQQSTSPCYDADELFGLGQLLKVLSEKISVLEDILTCGYDSRANAKESKPKPEGRECGGDNDEEVISDAEN